MLAERVTDEINIANPNDAAGLLRALREAGADDMIQDLLARNPAEMASLDDSLGVALLLRELWAAGEPPTRPEYCWPGTPPLTLNSITLTAYFCCWSKCINPTAPGTRPRA